MRDALRSFGFWQALAIAAMVAASWAAGARGPGFLLTLLLALGVIASGVIYQANLRSAVRRTLEVVERVAGRELRCEGLGLRYYLMCFRRAIRELAWLLTKARKERERLENELLAGPFAVAFVKGDEVLEANERARQLGLVPGKSPWGSVLSAELLELLKRGEGSGLFKVGGRHWLVQAASWGEETLLLGQDVTKEAEFSQLERTLVSAVAHHFRTPIAVISGYLELLGDDPRAQVALKHARALAETVERVLELARAGEAPLQLEELRLDELAEELASLYRARAEEKGVRLELVAEPVSVRSDRSLLYTVLQNLLDNAVKFTGPGGLVRVEVRREGRGAVISVEDTGEGMSPEELSRAFHKFWRGKGEGLGIGLALVAEAVKRLGGRLEAESRAGVGTRIRVILEP